LLNLWHAQYILHVQSGYMLCEYNRIIISESILRRDSQKRPVKLPMIGPLLIMTNF